MSKRVFGSGQNNFIQNARRLLLEGKAPDGYRVGFGCGVKDHETRGFTTFKISTGVCVFCEHDSKKKRVDKPVSNVRRKIERLTEKPEPEFGWD